MSDVHTQAQRHRNMAAIHSVSTKPEVYLRQALWRQGFRYKVNDNRYPGSPDIVLKKYRTAIFVHGCFWHGHNGCRYYTVPKTNTDFWVAKVARNKERDQEVWRKLEAKGWYVIIVWECQLKKGKLDETVERVVDEIVRNGESYRVEQKARRMAREEYRRDRMNKQEKEILLKNELLQQACSRH
jgi:DNA mismatch endonuclease (patch repair protein)